MLPLPHKSQITGAGNLPFSRLLQSTHIALFSLLSYHQTTTMTGHKDGSHKKRTITRLEDSALKRAQKKACLQVSPVSNTDLPLVSQTQQDSVVVPDSPTNPLVTVSDAIADIFNFSPTADHTAIAQMTAGRTN